MGGTSIGKRMGAYRVRWENLKERVYLKYAGTDGRILLNWLFRKWDEDIDWIDLNQDRDEWRAFEYSTMKCGFREMWKISWLANKRSAFQEGFCSME
jgi:hypothetical protein